jgi:hypothetical protein
MILLQQTMARARRQIGALVLAAGLLVPSPVLAAGDRAAPRSGGPHTMFGDIVVTAPLLAENPSLHGYVEHRFLITNQSTETSHEVKLTLPKVKQIGTGNVQRTTYSNGNTFTSTVQATSYLRSVSRTVRVPPSATVPVSLLQPGPLGGYNLEVTIDGRTQRDGVDLGVSQIRAFSNLSTVLVSQNLSNDLLVSVRKAAQALGPQWNMYSQWVPQETKGWSEQWLGYSSYDGVVVSRGELQAMGQAVRSALWRYVECGGSLLIVGPGEPPEPWKRNPPLQVKAFPQSRVPPLLSYSVGFGECVVSPETDLKRLDPPQWLHIVTTWKAPPVQQFQSVTARNRAFPVVRDLSTPVRGLFVVMLLFAVIIGPVNFYLLARKKRKIWMLWTVPAISLLTSLGVLGYMFVAEGWTGHVRAEGLTILDETTGRATTVGWIAFYTPLTPGEGLHFGYNTELTPQHAGRKESSLVRSSRTIDWTADQHLVSGWVTPRMPAHFMLRKSEARSERVAFRRAKDGSLSLENGLGAEIRRVWYADRQGKIHTASDIATGARAVLKPRGDALAQQQFAQGLRTVYGLNWLEHYEAFTTRPERYLRPGCYIAALDDAPFIEPGLRQAQRKGRSVVYGIGKEPADAN